MLLRVSAVVSVLCLWCAPARAHVDLDWPTMASTAQKNGPCGSPNAAAETFYFRPGQTIDVRYTETIYHEGHFRIAFAATPDDLTPPVDCGDVAAPQEQVGNMTVLADGIYPVAHAADDIMGCEGRVTEPRPGAEMTTQITFPDEPCENCVLQMIQFMTDKPPLGDAGGNDLYFRCAWVTLTDDPAITPSVDPNASPGTEDPVDPGDEDPADPDDPADPTGPDSSDGDVSGGCSAGGFDISLAGGLLMLLAFAALGRRRGQRARNR